MGVGRRGSSLVLRPVAGHRAIARLHWGGIWVPFLPGLKRNAPQCRQAPANAGPLLHGTAGAEAYALYHMGVYSFIKDLFQIGTLNII